MKKRSIETREEARQYAIDWQNWQSEASPSFGELAEWYDIFERLAEKFDLVEEFEENELI